MKTIKTIGLMFIGMVLSVTLLSCADDGSNGAPGLAGPEGPAGSDGQIGPAGPTGADGQVGPSGPAGPGVTWTTVSGATQAAPNRGYLADSASEVAITLLASAALQDIVSAAISSSFSAIQASGR